jgi:UDP-glucose 4-epimerase
MTVLVTGGCGYIGSHIVWAMKDNGTPTVVLDDLSTGDRLNIPTNCRLYVGDVGDSNIVDSIVAENKIDSIIHLAGKILPVESIENPLLYYSQNTCKTLSLVQSAIRNGIRKFIFSSTAAVYGSSNEPLVIEGAAKSPVSPYGHSKLFVEQILADTCRTGSLDAVALRYFNVAGTDRSLRCGPRGPNPGHLIRTAIDVALKRTPVLSIFGTDYETIDGTCIRDYIHVSDLANAHISTLQAIEPGIGFRALNCGYSTGVSVLQVIKAVEDAVGHRLETRSCARRLGDPIALVANANALREFAEWSPNFSSISEIVRSALEWERSKT